MLPPSSLSPALPMKLFIQLSMAISSLLPPENHESGGFCLCRTLPFVVRCSLHRLAKPFASSLFVAKIRPRCVPVSGESLSQVFRCASWRFSIEYIRHCRLLKSDPKLAGMDSSSSPIYHFKILVPAAAAGRIIGRGGTTIAQLQKDAGARVKMSKASEFYPGTTERVCLISGPIDGILKINDFFMENFPSTSIKILVPNSTAGMIIGKGGSYIKQIKEESGAYVQISQKCTDLSLPERCVTIVGELENIRKACSMILSKIVEDVGSAYRDIRASSITNSSLFSSLTTTLTQPSSLGSSSASSSPNSLSNNHGQIAHSFVKSLSPDLLGCPTTNVNSSTNSTNLCSPSVFPSAPSPHINSTPIAASATTSASAPTIATNTTATSPLATSLTSEMNASQIIESIKLVLRVSGYADDAVSEISSAMSTLASYGVLGVGLGLI